MSCPSKLFSLPFALTLSGTENQWRPLGIPVIIVGAAGVDLVVTVRQVSGNARVTAALELIAARPSIPGSVAPSTGGYTSTQTSIKNTYDLSGVSDKMLAQLGVVGNLSSGNTPAYIEGILTASINRCMTMLAERRIAVSGESTNANPNVYLLGRTLSSGAANIRAALIADGMKDMEYRFLVRGYVDPDVPTAWTALGSGYTGFTDGSTATCQGDLALSGITPANYHELEYGLALRLKSGGTAPAGFLRVIPGVSFS